MRFSILFLSTAALAAATASPEPTAAPDVALALAAMLRERQVSGQLPGLSGSVGTDGYVTSFISLHLSPPPPPPRPPPPPWPIFPNPFFFSGCGHVGPISGCFGAAGSQTQTLTTTTHTSQASTTTTIGTGTTGTTGTTTTKTGTATISGTKATSSSGAAAVRDYRRTSMGSVLAVVGLSAVSFAAFMA
jgi:hypothetical protein